MRFLSLLAAARLARAAVCLLALAAAPAFAYPTRAITMVVPFSPGTGIDISARVIGQHLGERWKTAIVIDNKPGASGNIGAELVARAQPDGHTLLMTATSFATNTAVNRSVPYDPVRNFAPVSLVATGTLAFVVHPGAGATTMREFVALAKAKPGALHYASSGNGTPQHLAMELFKLTADIDVVHVPYKASAGATTDLAGGRVQAMIVPVHTIAPFVHGGKARVLGVLAAERSAAFPDAATLREQGYPEMEFDVWYGLFAPAATPPEIIERLNREVAAILALPQVKEALQKQGLTPAGGAPDRLASTLRRDLERWPRVVAAAKIKAD